MTAITLSLILPIFNERQTLDELWDRCHRLKEILTPNLEIIFIDDGSFDGSREWIRAKKEEPHVKTIFHEVNQGIGPSIIDGYQVATGDWIVFLPTDLQFHPEDLEIAKPFMEKADIVCFYRKRRPDYTIYRKLVSWMNLLLNRILFGLKLKDINWVKLYKKWVVKDIVCKSNTPFVESERVIRATRRGARLIELESPYYLRTAGKPQGARIGAVIRSLLDVLWNLSLISRTKN